VGVTQSLHMVEIRFWTEIEILLGFLYVDDHWPGWVVANAGVGVQLWV